MKRYKMWLAAAALAAAMILLVGTAYARYREELVGDQAFQAKPAEALTFASQQWQVDEDGNRVLTFSLAQTAEDCRVYLAVSEGVTAPENLQIMLTLPAEPTVSVAEDGTETVAAPEPETLIAQAEAITQGSALYSLFGPGYVFRFYETEGSEAGEQISAEKRMDLKSEAIYTLTVSGLSSAVEQTSLLRLFVGST